MRTSLMRRACAAAALLLSSALASALPPATTAAAQPGDSVRKSEQSERSKQSEPGGAQVRLLGERTVPHKLAFDGTTVGGLSGIDRDRCTGQYVFISDDRSYLNPARFYTANLDVDAAGVHAVDFTGTHAFRRPDGATYPSPNTDPGKAVDPEEIRVDPLTCRYWWGQEGDRPRTSAEPVVQPSIQYASRTGGYRGSFRLPANYTISEDRGPRRNQVIEALSFGARGTRVTSAIEGPLLQDGPLPDTDRGALVRLTQQTRTGRVQGQFAYPLEKIFAPSDPTSPWGPDTGVPSLLAFPNDPDRYLVLERTWVAGSGYKIRIYDATTRGATDVQAMDALAGESVVPMRKTLVADFDDLGLSSVNNTEGMTWGPVLPNGERTLILVSDDNFSSDEATQIVALALT